MTTDITSALKAGSGIDIKTLAQNLTDVEKKPRQEAIQARIDKSEQRISGYGAVMFGLKQFREAFANLNDRSDFSGATVRNSAPSAFEATADADASADQHSVEVISLARAQISRSGNFADATTTLNGGNAFSLDITRGGTVTTVSVTRRSPEGVVDAINSKSAATGVSARLVNTGDPNNPMTIVLTGETGAANAFSVAQSAGQSPVPGLSFNTRLQSASDSSAVVDGIAVSRPDNTIDDVIPGVKLELLAPTTTGPGTLTIGRDTSPAKTKIEALVAAYNDLQDFIKTLGDPKSDDEEYGGVLEGDSVLRYVRDQARSMVLATSSTPGGTVGALRDIGVTIDRDGRLQIDQTKLDVSLLARFDDIAMAFSANTNNQSMLGDAPRGLAGDALKRLDAIMANDGPILSRNASANSQLTDAQEDLADLEIRMSDVYDRYLNQFAVMDGLVSQMNSLKDSLKNQFEGLAAMYTNK